MMVRVLAGLDRWWILLALAVLAGALIALPLMNALVVVGGALALVAVLQFPELALYALIFAVPFGSLVPIPVSVANMTAVDLIVLALVALWGARMILHDRAIRVHWPLLGLPLALFLGAALLSIPGALSLQFAAKELVKWLELAVVYVYVANTLTEAQRTRVLTALLLAGTAEAAIGIYQFLFRVGPEGFALFGRFMRAYGTFEQPNPYAGYLGLIIPIALGIVIGALNLERSQRGNLGGTWLDQKDNARRTFAFWISRFGLLALALIALAAMTAAVLMSWSRGAWLGVGAAVILVVVLQSRRALALTTIAAFVLVFAILLSSIHLVPDEITERFSGIGDYFGIFDVRGVKVDDANFAIVERMAHWQAAWDMWLDHPWVGVGFGNYAAVYPAYALPRWSDPLGHAHNYYLNVAAETGLVGLVAYLVLWGAAFWQGWRALRANRGLEHSMAAGLVGLLVMLAIHNGFDNLFVHGMAVQVGIGLGIAASLVNPVSQPKLQNNPYSRGGTC